MDCATAMWRLGFGMRKTLLQLMVLVGAGVVLSSGSARGGTWTDHFHKTLAPEWGGDNEAFHITTNGFLEGVSAPPVGVSPRNQLELPMKLTNVVVSCWVN